MKNQSFLFTVTFLLFFAISAISGCKKDNTPSHCNNSLRDGDETGVDCGGSCTACNIVNLPASSFLVDSAVVYDSCRASSNNQITPGSPNIYKVSIVQLSTDDSLEIRNLQGAGIFGVNIPVVIEGNTFTTHGTYQNYIVNGTLTGNILTVEYRQYSTSGHYNCWFSISL